MGPLLDNRPTVYRVRQNQPAVCVTCQFQAESGSVVMGIVLWQCAGLPGRFA